MTDNGTKCKYFWNHVALFNGKTATPCCRYDSSTKNNKIPTVDMKKPFTTFTESIHSQEWQTLRDNADNGLKEPGCWKCYADEEKGNDSLRLIANRMWEDEPVEPQLRYLEINLGNFCNLACNICCSDNSNLWYNDDKELSKTKEYRRGTYQPDHEKGISLNYDDYKDVKLIKFVGGEPMIHPKFIQLLDFLIENELHNSIGIQVFTNASWMPKEKVISRLKKFSVSTISLSVDGIGQVNDYSRWPSKWSIVHESVKEWIKTSHENENFYVRWEPTISIYNSNHIPAMVCWWIETTMSVTGLPMEDALYDPQSDDINIIFNNVLWPLYMKPNLLPTSDRECEKIDNTMSKIYNRHIDVSRNFSKLMLRKLEQRLEQAKRFISSDTDKESLDTFLRFTTDLDKLRNNNFAEQLPKLFSALKT